MMGEITSIFHLDRELERFRYIEIHKSYKKSKRWIIVATVLLIIYLSLILIFNIITYGSRTDVVFVGEVIAYVCPTIINTVMELQFCTMVLVLRRRFYWINNKLLEIGEFLKAPQNFHKEISKNEILFVDGK